MTEPTWHLDNIELPESTTATGHDGELIFMIPFVATMHTLLAGKVLDGVPMKLSGGGLSVEVVPIKAAQVNPDPDNNHTRLTVRLVRGTSELNTERPPGVRNFIPSMHLELFDCEYDAPHLVSNYYNNQFESEHEIRQWWHDPDDPEVGEWRALIEHDRNGRAPMMMVDDELDEQCEERECDSQAVIKIDVDRYGDGDMWPTLLCAEHLQELEFEGNQAAIDALNNYNERGSYE